MSKKKTFRWRKGAKKLTTGTATTESTQNSNCESNRTANTAIEPPEEPTHVPPPEPLSDSGQEGDQQTKLNDSLEQDRPYLPPRSIGSHLLWKRRRDSWVPIITVTVSLIGLILIGTQVLIYDDQRRIMNNQVSVAERNLRISERAYVGIASIKADLAQGEVVVMLENLGRLPANTIQMTGSAYLLSTRVDGYNNVFRAGEVQLFPGSFQMRVVIKTHKYSAEQIRAIHDKKQFLYLAGVIEYEDGFGFRDSTNFNFGYMPPPNEGWQAMSTPVAQMKESLEKMAFTLSVDPATTLTPSPMSSPLLTPTDRPSPLASVTATPKTLLSHSFKITSKTSNCGCICMVICGDVCDYECTGCGLVEGTEAARICCEAARGAKGTFEPCTNYD